jgi:hypothetical protein
MNKSLVQALSAATLRILRPLVRVLLRNGISYGTFADLAKWVYVDVATKDFAIPGRKQSVSRVAVITGLSRKEVSRVQDLPRPDDTAEEERYNRAARVIGGWLLDEAYQTDDAQPRDLAFEEGKPSFTSLVKKYSGDVPARAILDELLRVGNVQRLEDGKLRLMSHAYIPQESEVDKLYILGADTSALISTIDHNLNPATERKYYQRKVRYDNLPDEALPAFRALSAEKAQKLLEEFNVWLAKHDRDVNPLVDGTGRNSAGLGIYYFENPEGESQDGSDE